VTIWIELPISHYIENQVLLFQASFEAEMSAYRDGIPVFITRRVIEQQTGDQPAANPLDVAVWSAPIFQPGRWSRSSKQTSVRGAKRPTSEP
jgi:hypothetical protein